MRESVATIEAMRTCRAIRHLRPDPVPEELLLEVLQAATCANSPGNSQGWDFVVVRDADTRRRIGEAVGDAMLPVLESMPDGDDASRNRTLRGLRHLVGNLGEAPVLIFVCGIPIYPAGNPQEEAVWSTLYPAAQNLVVAARSLGLGTTFSQLHRPAEPAVRKILELPDEAKIAVTIPLGWPDRKFGPVKREPLEKSLHWDRW
jgi:nitroreductase